jgi:hypothetical protein
MLLKNPPTLPELPESEESEALVLDLLAGAAATAGAWDVEEAFVAGDAVLPKVAVSQPLVLAPELGSDLTAGSAATTTASDAAGALLIPASR